MSISEGGGKVWKEKIGTGRKERSPLNFAHAEVATLDPNTMRTLCEEYIANNYIDPETSERLGVKRGLRNPDGTGVLAGLTNVCDVVGYKKDQEGHVIPTPGKLIYRGVNINEIVEEAYRNDRFVFEEGDLAAAVRQSAHPGTAGRFLRDPGRAPCPARGLYGYHECPLPQHYE